MSSNCDNVFTCLVAMPEYLKVKEYLDWYLQVTESTTNQPNDEIKLEARNSATTLDHLQITKICFVFQLGFKSGRGLNEQQFTVTPNQLDLLPPKNAKPRSSIADRYTKTGVYG